MAFNVIGRGILENQPNVWKELVSLDGVPSSKA